MLTTKRWRCIGAAMAAAALPLAAATSARAAAAAHSPDPASVSTPVFHVGDAWVFDRSHEKGKTGFTQERVLEQVERVGPDTMLLGVKLDGAPGAFEDHMVGLDLSQRRIVDGESKVSDRFFSFPMKVGSTWQEDYVDPRRQGMQTSVHVTRTYKVVGWEDVVVPAGAFRAMKIEADGKLVANVYVPATAVSAASASPSGATTVAHAQKAQSGVVTHTTYRLIYYAPEIKFFVKTVNEQYDGESVRTERDTDVLVSYKPGG